MVDERVAKLLGQAAMDVWGDVPRDVQEASKRSASAEHGVDGS
jgi:hypothetical protein